jgi:hypothetical protein
MWRVRVSDADLARLHEVTTKRCETKSTYSVATQKYDRRRTDWEICYFGFMGEVGVARALCIEPNWSVLIGGDSGADVSFGGNMLQIKTPLTKQTRDWFYFNDEERFAAEYGVLCNIDDYETSVLIRGAVLKEDFLSLSVTKNFGYGERIAVHVSQMAPMDELISAVQAVRQQTVGEKC